MILTLSHLAPARHIQLKEASSQVYIVINGAYNLESSYVFRTRLHKTPMGCTAWDELQSVLSRGRPASTDKQRFAGKNVGSDHIFVYSRIYSLDLIP